MVLLDFTKDAEKPKTQRFLAYGGDFNERPTDYSFCCNGIVMATSGAFATVRGGEESLSEHPHPGSGCDVTEQ